MADTLIPSQVAAIVGTDASTIRRWCSWHSVHLSDGATPQPGGQRQLTAQDVEVLRRVKELRLLGLQTPAINESLAGVTFAVVESPEQHQAAHDEAGQAIVPVSVVDAIERISTQIRAELRAELDQRLQPIESQRLRIDVTVVAIAAFVAGLIVGLAVWWFQ